jgi:diguanylate cyclase (GGDEF)-like protein
MSNIIIIDDEERLGESLKTLLISDGYSVTFVTRGEDGIDMIKNGRYNILITDILMPGMDGFEVIKRVKEINPSILIIVITGYASMDSAVRALKEGAYDYIIKPFDYDLILNSVKRAVERIKLEEKIKEEENRLREYAKELKNKNKLLLELSNKDELTGVYNHRYFVNKLKEEFNRATRYNLPLTCVMIDIDDFKNINDLYGHPTGDKVLKKLGELLKDSIRDVDIVARYGGEEFVLILPLTDSENGIRMAERCRNSIENNDFGVGNRVIKITISLGVATYYNDNMENENILIGKADKALYVAKRKGKNRVESLPN